MFTADLSHISRFFLGNLANLHTKYGNEYVPEKIYFKLREENRLTTKITTAHYIYIDLFKF